MLPAMYVIPHGGIFVIANLDLQRVTELRRAIGRTVVGDPKRSAAANPRMLCGSAYRVLSHRIGNPPFSSFGVLVNAREIHAL